MQMCTRKIHINPTNKAFYSVLNSFGWLVIACFLQHLFCLNYYY